MLMPQFLVLMSELKSTKQLSMPGSCLNLLEAESVVILMNSKVQFRAN